MDSVKGVLKKGWHPEKNNGGATSSSGSGWRNKPSEWIGRAKGSEPPTEHSTRTTAPISSLPDPSSFGPPPRHVALQGGGHVAPRPVAARSVSSTHLTAGRSSTTAATPALPPRLPPRQSNTSSSPQASPTLPPPPYTLSSSSPSDPYLNQAAVNNLARAGVNIPEFGIGKLKSGGNESNGNAPPPPLPARTSGSSTPSSAVNMAPPLLPPRQSSFSTATSSPVLRSSVDSRLESTNRLVESNAVSELKKFAASDNSLTGHLGRISLSQSQTSVNLTSPTDTRKKPPPPPPKKKTLTPQPPQQVSTSQNGPPPIPLASKPKFC